MAKANREEGSFEGGRCGLQGVLEEVGLKKKNGENVDGRRGMGAFWVIITSQTTAYND